MTILIENAGELARLEEDDLFLMLASYIRYALPRHTYIVGACADTAIKMFHLLDKISQDNIIKEIRDELKRNKGIWDMDRKVWEGTLAMLEEIHHEIIE